MASLLPGIALEALAGFTKKLGRHAQVHLRMLQLDVTQIDRQVMQEPLYVGTLLIPGGETVNGERMAQVVNSWLFLAYQSDGCLRDRTATRKFLWSVFVLTGPPSTVAKKGASAGRPFRPSAVVLNQASGSVAVPREPVASCRTSCSESSGSTYSSPRRRESGLLLPANASQPHSTPESSCGSSLAPGWCSADGIRPPGEDDGVPSRV